MKKLFLLLAVCCFLSNITLSQSIWIPQYQVSDPLYSIYFTDINTGYVCGDSGLIMKTTNGGYNWTSQVSNTTKDLRSIFFLNSNTGWAVGGKRTGMHSQVVTKTTNGGINWVRTVNVDTSMYWFQSVCFIDELTGFLINTDNDGTMSLGNLYKTTDGGYSFFQSIGATVGVRFMNYNTGFCWSYWFSGPSIHWGVIQRTTDAGNNWTQIYYDTNAINITDVQFLNYNTGYFTAYLDRVYKTTNGGLNWYMASIYSGTYNERCLHFIDVATGWVAGDNISKSTNGGASWTIESNAQHIYGLSIADSNNRWFCTSEGQIWRNGFGPSISHTPLQNSEQITGTRPVNCQITPYNAGINPGLTRLYFKKQPITTWTQVQLNNTVGTIWTGDITLNGAGTYNYYITTTDSANKTITSPPFAPTNYYSFTQAIDTTKPIITHTPIGNTLKSNWPKTVNASVTDPFGVDSVWVKWYKNTPATLKRFNLASQGGNVWSAPFNSTQSEVNINDSIFYRIFARDNSVAHNIDSSILYSFKIIPLTNSCIGVGSWNSPYPFRTSFSDARSDLLYLASEIIGSGLSPGNITNVAFNITFNSNQAMNNFNLKMQTTTDTVISEFRTTGWTICYSGNYTISAWGWKTINLQTPFYWDGTSNILIEICYNNSSYSSQDTYAQSTNLNSRMVVWAENLPTGDGCTAQWSSSASNVIPNICFTIITDEEIKGINIPSNFNLHQNFPNPFNPVTKINYEIPKQSFVTLKVYDILGREIKIMVNEIKTAGYYTVDFNGAELPSGIYFYRLQSNEFSEVKRMILIK